MKIAIISDTHAGARNSSDAFIDYQGKFYTEVFFPYLIKNNIKTIIHLGDYYEHRKFINFKAMNANREHFLDKLVEYGITMYIIPGNHDVYYKNTNALCSLDLLLKGYEDNVVIYHNPETLTLDGLDIDLIPWINSENNDEIMKFIETSQSRVCMGHFEFTGFYMYPGAICKNGMSTDYFEKFDMVLSGHFHTKSERGSIKYLGAQMEFTWGDVDDPKYFHVLDTKTLELEEVQNPITLFQKVIYNDEVFEYSSFDFSIFKDKYVKIIVEKKTDHYLFDHFVESVLKSGIHDLKIAETFEEFTADKINTTVEFQETLEIVDAYVEASNTHLDKRYLKDIIRGLYNEAQAMEYE